MNLTTLLELTSAVVVGFAAGRLPLLMTHKKKLEAHGKNVVSTYISQLNTKFKTVERRIGACSCGVAIVVIDMIPASLNLSTNISPKTVIDPTTGKQIQQFRALLDGGRVS